jgi:hypothetical protein
MVHTVAHIPNDIFQFSTFSSVTHEFNITNQPRAIDLQTHGTDGIGVFEDGHLMILSNLDAYTICPDNGKATPAHPEARLTFAMVTIYRPLRAVRMSIPSLQKLEETLSITDLDACRILGTGGVNSYMPVQIEARFKSVSLKHKEDGDIIVHKEITGIVFGFAVPRWMNMLVGRESIAIFWVNRYRVG